MIRGGDFNISIGNEGNLVDRDEQEKREERRASKDKVISNRRRKMLDFISSKGGLWGQGVVR